MACEFIYDKEGKLVAVMCGSPWGIGVYNTAEYGPIYGFPPKQMNPHDFSPDEECCTEAEINAWKEACDAFDAEANK